MNNKVSKLIKVIVILMMAMVIEVIVFNCNTVINNYLLEDRKLDLETSTYQNLDIQEESIITTTNDPMIIYNNLDTYVCNVEINTTSNENLYAQVFYDVDGKGFSEEKSVSLMIPKGEDRNTTITFSGIKKVESLRIDPSNQENQIIKLNDIEINTKLPMNINIIRILVVGFAIAILIRVKKKTVTLSKGIIIIFSAIMFGFVGDIFINIFKTDINGIGIIVWSTLLLLFIGQICYFKKKNIGWEKIFLILGGTYGIIFSITFPIFQTPDEYVHYWRAYNISQGEIGVTRTEQGDGGYLPAHLNELTLHGNTENLKSQPHEKIDLKDYMNIFKIEPTEEVRFYSMKYTDKYVFTSYIPQAVGIIIGRILNLPAAITFFLARITNLVVYLGVVYLGIKNIPKYKEALAIVALLPISLQQAASNSPDALLISSSLCAIGFIVKMRESTVTRRDLCIIGLCIGIITLIKVPYVLIIFLMITGCKKYTFKDIMKNIGMILLILVPIVTLYFMWNKNYALTPIRGEGIVNNTLFDILRNPLIFIEVCINTLRGGGDFVLNSMIAYLGWLDTLINPVMIKFYIVGILVWIIGSYKYNRDIIMKEWIDRLLGVGLFFGIITVICMGIHTWSPVGNSILVGIQGRYFVPILAILIIHIWGKTKSKTLDLLGIINISTLLIYSTFTVILRYYVA